MTSVSSHIGFSLSRFRRLRLLPIVALLSLSPAYSAAQKDDAEIRTAARDLASQGIEAFERHDYAAAIDRFERAFALVPAPSISVMHARSLVQIGRYLEALDVYEKTQRMPLPPDAPEAFKQAVSDAHSESEGLWRSVPRLTIHVQTLAPPPSDLTIALDSKRVPAALLDVSRPADPGPHRITAHAVGFNQETRSVLLEPGSQTTVDIPLVAADSNTPVLMKESTHDAPPARGSQATQILGWSGVGVGSAGFVLSGITGIIALKKHSTLESQCHPGCPVSAADDLSTFRTTRTISYASFIVGAASLGVGSYLLLSGSSHTPSVGATIGPEQVALWGRF